MKRLILAAAMVPAILVGCNDSSNGGSSGNDSLGTPSFVINSSNRAQVDQVAGSTAMESSTQTYISGDGSRSLLTGSSFVAGKIREISSRTEATGEISCASGSGSMEGSVTGVGENGEAEANGSMSVVLTYDNCTQDSSSGDNTTHDGKQGLDIEWTGYNDSTGQFESLSVTASFENYYNKTVVGGAVESESTVDGSLTLSANKTEYRASFSLAMSSPEIDDKVIMMETTADIVRGVSDTYPTSGEIVVTGGEDTKAVYSVVANGVEVSLNGGQKELVSWSEIEAEDSPF